MTENKDMFTQDAIDGARSFLENKGLLNPQGNEEKNISKTDQNESPEEETDGVANENE